MYSSLKGNYINFSVSRALSDGRAEELARKVEYRETFSLCVSRAVAPLATLVIKQELDYLKNVYELPLRTQ